MHDDEATDAGTHDAKTYNAETQNDDTHSAEGPVSDDFPQTQSLTTAATAPECDQKMQTDDEPLNLTIQKIVGQAYSGLDVIDLTSGALDLRLKK